MAFLDVTVQPSYGKRKVLINWTVVAGYEDLKFYVFRSLHNGAPPWKALSKHAIRGTSFEDDAFVVNNRMQQAYYQIVGTRGDEKFYSQPIGLFDKLSRSEYGAVFKIMKAEEADMHSGRLGNGISVWHFLPLLEGERNENYDPETGQKLILNCMDSDSYGLPFKGGYGPPSQTWIKLNRIGPEIYSNDEKGKGSDTTYRHQARMLAFPKPMTNHLIVHPATDNRYVVGEQIQPSLFRGIVAVAYDVELLLLRRNDPRYKVPLS
jgi:hypothetical protein